MFSDQLSSTTRQAATKSNRTNEVSDYVNLGKALYFSFCFCLLYIAFNTTQNLTSQVEQDNGLGNIGFTLLSIIYGCQGIGGFIGPAIHKKLGDNISLVIGGFCIFTFIAATILPAWRGDYPVDKMDQKWQTSFIKFLQKTTFIEAALYASAALNGLGSAILWVAQGNYCANLATEKSMGFFMGMFYAIYQSSIAFGSLMGAVVFQYNYNKTVFFILMSAIATVAVVLMGLLRQPYIHKSETPEK